MSIFKITFMSAPLVRHVYCQLFVADGPETWGATCGPLWTCCGNLTMRKSEFEDFRDACRGATFEHG